MAADERDELTLGGVSAQARAKARLRPLPSAVVARLGGVLRADELEVIYTSNAIEGSTLTLTDMLDRYRTSACEEGLPWDDSDQEQAQG